MGSVTLLAKRRASAGSLARARPLVVARSVYLGPGPPLAAPCPWWAALGEVIIQTAWAVCTPKATCFESFLGGSGAVVDHFGQAASLVLAAAQVCHGESVSVVLAADPVAQLCEPFFR